ncbi:CPBP family glutamic-type intramembrane protease [Paenibacillus lentus]|uniref:CPBP family intramembrane metalloprotease n=1 Tax=Paenibacillus lentus TaxID=1338368 RepID=A0A3Q8S4J0_9BACL|nr:CPBP family glutamic-type intramembrane protease [Paenibacillus lentus]AZK46286.1 CPBP family intramembrane metalloprotease [Paenibacillus lentus]
MFSFFSSTGRTPKRNTVRVLAAVGLLLFLTLQFVLPMFTPGSVEQIQKTITKQQATELAAEFARSTLELPVPLDNALVTYETRSDIYGYLSKEGLMKTYTDTYGEQFPLEVFRVRFEQPDNELKALTVDVNMYSGRVVGFERILTYSNATKELLKKQGLENSESLQAMEGYLSLEDRERLAEPYLKAFGFDPAKLRPNITTNKPGLVYDVSGYESGQSHGMIQFNYEDGEVSSMETYFDPPKAHSDYVKGQKKLANWFTWAGYALFTFVLGILAIVYSVKTRPFSSFVRGLVLSSIYFIFSMAGAINMLPMLQVEGMGTGILIIGFVIQGLVTLLLAASIYFSLVGGDGLWRKEGFNLWARAKEPEYGRHVLASMQNGYLWALILLGTQSVIFLILERVFGTWSTTDPTQSAYNMLYPVLFPLLAWVAGIGEEAVYRLFGIPMLKKIFRSTFIASLLSSIIWAFGHTLYPIYPVYSRPIELAIIGLMFSFVFLRYGYITAMFTHVIFNSILMSLSLMLMGGALNWSAGIFYIALPAIVAFVIYLFNPPGRKRSIPPVQPKEEEPLLTTPRPEGHL